MTLLGQSALASAAPCFARSACICFSTVEPGTCTEPDTGSYVKWLTLVSVTLTLPVAPLSQVTEQVNVAPASDFSSVGHLVLVTFASAVESCLSIPLSTAAVSTILACGVVVDFAVLDEFELSQPATATATAAKQGTIAARAPRPSAPSRTLGSG